MRKIGFVTAALVATVTLASVPASAKMMGCTVENMAKSSASAEALPDGPQKAGLMREMALANTAISKGDMGGACRIYMRAQKTGLVKS